MESTQHVLGSLKTDDQTILADISIELTVADARTPLRSCFGTFNVTLEEANALTERSYILELDDGTTAHILIQNVKEDYDLFLAFVSFICSGRNL